MSREKDYKCVDCGKFVAYKTLDRAIHYGCADYDSPEPYDPIFFCGKCAKKEYKEALKLGVNMTNYWEKPNFQIKAMEKLGIIEKNFKLIREEETNAEPRQ